MVHANVGISMGITGTHAAMEAADIVVVEDKLEKIVLLEQLVKKPSKTIKENIIVGVGVVHVIEIALVLLGITDPLQAAVLHLFRDTLVFLNFIKLLKYRTQAKEQIIWFHFPDTP